jgi:hypothetical protein
MAVAPVVVTEVEDAAVDVEVADAVVGVVAVLAILLLQADNAIPPSARWPAPSRSRRRPKVIGSRWGSGAGVLA